MSAPPLHSDVHYWRAADLPRVEIRAAAYRREVFRTHTHREFSLGVLLAGSTRFFLRGSPRTARAGQIVVIPPLAPHACNPETGGLSYRMFAIAPELVRNAMGGTLPAFPPAFEDARLFAALNALFAAFVAVPADGGEDRAALLRSCLRGLAARHGCPGKPRRIPRAVQRAREKIAGNRGPFLSLDELAQAANLSRRQFLRTFKATTGLTPHSYQLQQAVDRAKKTLREGVPFSEAALDAGFADQSHFTRCFRRFTGATPGQYAATRKMPEGRR